MLKKDLHDEELKKLLDYLQSDKARPQDLIFEILLATGMRTEEFCKLPLNAFNRDTKYLTLDSPAKGSNPASYDLNINGLGSRIEAHLMLVDMTLYESDLFIWTFTRKRIGDRETLKRWMRRQWEYVRFHGIGPHCKLGPHTLRHTVANRALKLGASMEVIQKLLRHKSMSSTIRYIRDCSSEEFLIHQREIMASLYDDEYGR